MKNLNKKKPSLIPSMRQIGLSLLLSTITLSVSNCAEYINGNYCSLYTEIYTSDEDKITEETQNQIDDNNAVYYCGCVNPKHWICK